MVIEFDKITKLNYTKNSFLTNQTKNKASYGVLLYIVDKNLTLKLIIKRRIL